MENFYYKIKDIEDDEYSEYIWTDKKCGTIIKKAIAKYHNEGNDCVIEYIKQELDNHNIKWAIIDWNEIEY